MDTSKIYIKMCDCPEIQGQWGLIEGDYYYNSGDTFEGKFQEYRETRLLIMDGHINGRNHLIEDRWKKVTEHGKGRAKDYIWLPRQDQIQEMFIKDYDQPSTQLTYCNLFAHNSEVYEGIYRKAGMGLTGIFHSMEQIWLAFYMYEKHQEI